MSKTHNYFFAFSKELPWAKYDELGRRIRDDGVKDESLDKESETFDTKEEVSNADPKRDNS